MHLGTFCIADDRLILGPVFLYLGRSPSLSMGNNLAKFGAIWPTPPKTQNAYSGQNQGVSIYDWLRDFKTRTLIFGQSMHFFKNYYKTPAIWLVDFLRSVKKANFTDLSAPIAPNLPPFAPNLPWNRKNAPICSHFSKKPSQRCQRSSNGGFSKNHFLISSGQVVT